MNLDPITDDKEFEHFCKWIARDNFGPNVFLYSKYNQNGIDIYWTSKGKYHVVQCKQRSMPKPSELINLLESDFITAEKYFGNELKQFVFATTASLKVSESKVNRKSGIEESLLEACNRISLEKKVDIVLWHWDYLQEKVIESPFLLRHLLNREEGADLIHQDFIDSNILKYKGRDERQNKIEYYGGNEDIQWYGIHQNLDAPREIYNSLIECISSSFIRPEPVAAVIRGEGGSGKSVFLRRLAITLKEKYTIYWLGNNIEAFLDNELLYDVEMHPESKYIIILEDWYRNIERVGNKAVANQLLNKLKKTPNARIVIGDRKDKRKIYDEFVGSSYTYDLFNSENLKLLKDILIKMPEWENFITDVELNDISNATLFIALFVFCYSETYDNKEGLTDRYKRIFKSDYSKLIEKNTPFEVGLANALYLYANLYGSKNYGITLTIQTLLDWACYYGNCSIPAIYLSSNKRLLESNILRKYLKIEELKTKFSGFVHKVRFHHDTMAEQGWANNHELIEVEFNEASINDLIELLKKTNHLFDLRLLYYRLSKQPGEKGKAAAREYIITERPDINFNAFCFCLNLLKGEGVAKQAARDFLETENPHLNYSAFCFCLDFLKGEKITKEKAEEFLIKDKKPWENKEAFTRALEALKGEKIAREKAEEFLAVKNEKLWEKKEVFTRALEVLKKEQIAKEKAEEFLINEDKPWENYHAFSKALEVLKDEEVAKQAARDFLQTENPHLNYWAFSASLMILDLEVEGLALQIVQNRTTQNWSFVFHSLNILCKTNKYNGILNEVASEILISKKSDWFKYREWLKIPLFNIPLWTKETEFLIHNWRYQTGYKRNYLFSLLNHSYKEFPEKLKEMSIGIVRNWKEELTSKTKHKAYFTRCLANVGFVGNEKLKNEVVQICKEICQSHAKTPLELTPNLEEVLTKIAQTGEFPKWKYEEI